MHKLQLLLHGFHIGGGVLAKEGGGGGSDKIRGKSGVPPCGDHGGGKKMLAMRDRV